MPSHSRELDATSEGFPTRDLWNFDIEEMSDDAILARVELLRWAEAAGRNMAAGIAASGCTISDTRVIMRAIRKAVVTSPR